MRNKNKSWYKPKGYLHFSPRLKEEQKEFVTNYIETNLENHNFFPLIHETITARRYKPYINKDGTIYRSHYDVDKSKSSKKPREIFYANHLDAHIYSYFSNEILGKHYETLLKNDPTLSETIIAYRKIPIDKQSIDQRSKCNIHFAQDLFEEIKKRKNCVVVCYDIENFFPSLNHAYIETCWQELIKAEQLPKSHRKVFNSLTRYSYVEMRDIVDTCADHIIGVFHKNDFIDCDLCSYFVSAKEFREKIAKKNLIRRHKSKTLKTPLKGIPQGTPISAFLANLYLLEFDKFIVDELVKKNNHFYRRYSDDIAIIFDTMNSFEKWDQAIRLKMSSEPFCLTINPHKTVISEFRTIGNKSVCLTKTDLCKDYSERHALKYLGFEYDGNVTLLKPASLSKYYREMKMAIRRKSNRVNAAKRYNKRHSKRQKKDTKLYLTKLHLRFTHHGKNKRKSNYLTYVDRAARVFYPNQSGNSNPIRKQVRRSWSIFMKTVKRYEN